MLGEAAFGGNDKQLFQQDCRVGEDGERETERERQREGIGLDR